jgi:NAD(P)-dependent dehydrogenase (short-subunit alcohol dehydrogenase family)
MATPTPPPPLALVTGAAHRLGRAIALGLAQRGYAIGLHYNQSGQAAQSTAAELEAQGIPVVRLQANLRQPAEIDGLFEQIAATPYPLQVLVNSAGVMPRQDLLTLDPAEWDATLTLNLRAPWLMARGAAKLMKTGGAIINISDAGAGLPWTGYPAYTISKAGLETLTRLLARALAPVIRVNAVAPGLILPAEQLPAGEWERLVNRLPLRQSGSPQDIVDAVLFLVNSPHITGQTLVVDGGYQLIAH